MTTEETQANPSTSKEQGLPSPRCLATDQEIIVELSRLSVQMAHQGNPNKQDIALKLAAMCDDLRGKTLEEIRDGCRRYRKNPANNFFPAPGQLLEAMKNPYADPPAARRPFYRADDDFRRKSDAERTEADTWMRQKVAERHEP